jgi:hypothetical protein
MYKQSPIFNQEFCARFGGVGGINCLSPQKEFSFNKDFTLKGPIIIAQVAFEARKNLP